MSGDRRGSSPLSLDDAPATRTPSKFSIDNLVSSENSATVASPVPSTVASLTSSPQKPASDDDVRAKSKSTASPITNGSRKRQRTSDATIASANETADTTASNGIHPPEELADGSGDEGDDDEEGDDDAEDAENAEGDGADDDEDDDDEEDDEEDDEDDEDDDASTGSRDLEEPTAKDDAADQDDDVVMVDAPSGKSTTNGDGSAVTGDTTGKGASGEASQKKVTKVVKKRKQREPSMDVSLPKGPPSLPTVRIQLKCRPDDHGEYLNNIPEEIYQDLKAKKHPWATWYETKRDTGGSGPSGGDRAGPSSARAAPALPEGLGDMGPFAHLLAKYPVEAPGGSKPRRKRRKRHELEEYDVNDPFVDDSELQIDEPTHSARPASKGFYVVLGDVELEKIGKQKRGAKGGAGTSTPTAGPSAGARGAGGGPAPPSYLISGTQLEVSNRMIHLRAMERGLSNQPSISPDEIPDDAIGLVGSGHVAGTRESPIEVKDDSAAANAKKKNYPTRPVDRRLAAEFEHLKKLVSDESFLVKARFPPTLRPPLRKAARLALELGEYTDNFFNFMPQMFPYNRFTMSKLIKREFFEDHVSMIKEKQDELFDDLKQAIEEVLPQHRADYEKALKQWKEGGGKDSNPSQTAATTRENSGEPDDDGAAAGDANDTSASNSKSSGTGAEPIKKWKWTERMREDVFQIILIENGITELRIEKAKLENSLEQISELVQRKAVYKRLNDLWPENEGWTTTTGISKEHAIQKKKHDRHNNALAEQAAG